MSLFPENRTPPPEVSSPDQIRLSQMTLRRPRRRGGCRPAMELWNQPGLDSFNATYDVLLYDLTGACFECDPPEPPADPDDPGSKKSSGTAGTSDPTACRW
jgi:hypothetical protein